MDEVGQYIFDLNHSIVVQRNQQQFSQMVKSMVTLFDFLQKKNKAIK